MPLFGNSDVVVFGVQVPGFEGTAGMAAIAVDLPSGQEFRQLYAEMRVALPAYAMPIFIRIMSSAHAHSTGWYLFSVNKLDSITRVTSCCTEGFNHRYPSKNNNKTIYLFFFLCVI